MGNAEWVDQAESDCGGSPLYDHEALLLSSSSQERTTSVVGSVVGPHQHATSSSGKNRSTPCTPLLRVHPLLYEYLSMSGAWNGDGANEADAPIGTPVTLAPRGNEFGVQGAVHGDTNIWYAQPVDSVQILPSESIVTLHVLYHVDANGTLVKLIDGDDELTKRRLALELQGRQIAKGAAILLTTTPPSTGGSSPPLRYAMAVIHDLVVLTSAEVDLPPHVYRVGDPGTYTLGVTSIVRLIDEDSPRPPTARPRDTVDAPGYEALRDELMHLLTVRSAAAPTGIWLAGCAGVGKSRLVASACVELKYSCHWVSARDLVLQATTPDRVREALQPPRGCTVLVLDDLDALGADIDSPKNDPYERQLVRNAIVQVIDQFAAEPSVAVLGLSQDSLPAEIVKIGRLEKQVPMMPPSQRQREQILYSIMSEQLKSPGSSEDGDPDASRRHHRCEQWSELLATMTAGCVAADLRRLCADAWNRCLTRTLDDVDDDNLFKLDDSCFGESLLTTPVLTWDDLSEASLLCVPSQLAALDVTKPSIFLGSSTTNDWRRIHDLCWMDFAGYTSMRKHIYRTVVVPWRRLLSRDDSPAPVQGGIVPPSGVLFHGPSGCGKTLAANCLGSSLGLPMIKVRAADVLDKWLGGSESALRMFFTRARASAPSILFFDEIDAVASNRASAEDGATAGVMSRILSTLLNEMDGISSREQAKVLVVACTNRLDALDAALLRPGRLEAHALLPEPTYEDAKEILKNCLALAPLHKSVILDSVAQDLVDRSASGAAICGACREAVFRALRRHPLDASEVFITTDDITGAIAAVQL